MLNFKTQNKNGFICFIVTSKVKNHRREHRPAEDGDAVRHDVMLLIASTVNIEKQCHKFFHFVTVFIDGLLF